MVRGSLRSHEKVLVTGASGGVGSAAVALTSRYGCEVIATTGSLESKANYIASLGAKAVVDSTLPFSKKIGSSCDMVIECVGAPTFSESLKCLKPGGRLILIGNVTNASAPLPLGLCIVKSLSVIGTDSIEAHELSSLFQWLSDRSLRPEIQQVLSLDEKSLCEAHELLEKRRVTGRLVIDVNAKIWE
jgi:acryloyl-coenzyme A reductase